MASKTYYDLMPDRIGIAYVDGEHFLELKKEREEAEQQQQQRKHNINNKNRKEEEVSDENEFGFLKDLYKKYVLPIEAYLIAKYTETQRYYHCEIVFFLNDHRENNCLAYGVMTDLGVFRKKRTFSNSSYRWIFLKTTSEETARIKIFCDSKVGQLYDKTGVKWSKFWYTEPPKPKYIMPTSLDEIKEEGKTMIKNAMNDEKWWCSSFVVKALQQIGIFSLNKAESLDIDNIVDVLEKHPRSMNLASPFEVKVVMNNFTRDLFSIDDGNNENKYSLKKVKESGDDSNVIFMSKKKKEKLDAILNEKSLFLQRKQQLLDEEEARRKRKEKKKRDRKGIIDDDDISSVTDSLF